MVEGGWGKHLHVVREPAGALEQRHRLLPRELVQAAIQRAVREEVLEGLLALRARGLLAVGRPPQDAFHCESAQGAGYDMGL